MTHVHSNQVLGRKQHRPPGIQQTCWEELGTEEQPRCAMRCNREGSTGPAFRKRSCTITTWHWGSIRIQERHADEQESHDTSTNTHPTRTPVYFNTHPAREGLGAAPGQVPAANLKGKCQGVNMGTCPALASRAEINLLFINNGKSH